MSYVTTEERKMAERVCFMASRRGIRLREIRLHEGSLFDWKVGAQVFRCATVGPRDVALVAACKDLAGRVSL